jgi:hypothetical protein
MDWIRRLILALPFILVLMALLAAAQFEGNPDSFDDQPSTASPSTTQMDKGVQQQIAI